MRDTKVLESLFLHEVLLTTEELLWLVRKGSEEISKIAALEINVRVKELELLAMRSSTPTAIKDLPEFHTLKIRLQESIRNGTLHLS